MIKVESFTDVVNFRMLVSGLRSAGYTTAPLLSVMRTRAEKHGSKFIAWFDQQSCQDTFGDTIEFYFQQDDVC